MEQQYHDDDWNLVPKWDFNTRVRMEQYFWEHGTPMDSAVESFCKRLDLFYYSGLVIGPGQVFDAQVRSGQVSHLWFRFGFGKFPLKIPNFSLWIKKIASDWIEKYPVQRRFRLLFTAGQKYAWVRTGQGPSLLWMSVGVINVCLFFKTIGHWEH